MNPLSNHRHALTLGIVIALVLTFAVGGAHFNELAFARWFHIVAGVFWIGLLYYFNVAQTPALADAAADKGGPGGAGITKYVAPRALFWFGQMKTHTLNSMIVPSQAPTPITAAPPCSVKAGTRRPVCAR